MDGVFILWNRLIIVGIINMQISKKQAEKAIVRALAVSDNSLVPSHYTSHIEATTWFLITERRRGMWDGQFESAIALLDARGFIRATLA